jgi:site-specific DNA-methyltransferase (adenine-specific)
MAVRIEDAGFEIRDMIAWVYGSGFPKSHNIGKAVDKLQGNEREVVGTSEGKGYSSIQEKNIEQDNRPYVDGLPYLKADRTLTKGNSPYEGYGTALKPALEPITVARKPISEKTVAQNVLKYGTGGINIDGCRVEHDEPEVFTNRTAPKSTGEKMGMFAENGKLASPNQSGRFPANLIHDGSDEVVSLFPNSKSSDAIRRNQNSKTTGINTFGKYQDIETSGYSDSGSASRFFYCAKASKSERNRGLEEFEENIGIGNYMAETKWINDPRHKNGGYEAAPSKPQQNHHPTVKPISLMRYLCRLVTPKGGTVLDPFMGSGTTGIGAKLEGFNFIGIEREAEYIKIAEARINAWEKEKQKKLV